MAFCPMRTAMGRLFAPGSSRLSAAGLGQGLGRRSLSIVSAAEPRPAELKKSRARKAHAPAVRGPQRPDGLRMPRLGPVVSGRQLVPPLFQSGLTGRLASALYTRAGLDKLPGLYAARRSLDAVRADLAASEEGKAVYAQLYSDLATTNLDASEQDLLTLEQYAEKLELCLPVQDLLKDMVLAGTFNLPTLQATSEKYTSQLLAARHVHEVFVTSAEPLNTEDRLKVKVGLQTSNLSTISKDSRVWIHYRVDPDIKGGFIVEVPRENQRFDLSLRSRHEMLEWIARRGF